MLTTNVHVAFNANRANLQTSLEDEIHPLAETLGRKITRHEIHDVKLIGQLEDRLQCYI